MKKLLFAAVVSLFFMSCGETAEKKEDAAADSKNGEMTAQYEKNLATIKAFTAAFEKEDAAGMAALVADTAVWASPAYGDTVTTKAHWMESLQYYLDNWSNLHLANGQFLAGVDADTNQPDGSVRYYGNWTGVHSSGKETSVKYYGTFDFNAENKIVFGSDFFDLGGMMNAVTPKK